jgi:hypothetical protein
VLIEVAAFLRDRREKADVRGEVVGGRLGRAACKQGVATFGFGLRRGEVFGLGGQTGFLLETMTVFAFEELAALAVGVEFFVFGVVDFFHAAFLPPLVIHDEQVAPRVTGAGNGFAQALNDFQNAV